MSPRRRKRKPEDGGGDRIVVGNVLLFSVREVARVLQVHETRAYQLVRDDVLSVTHTSGRKRYVRASDVERYRQRRDAWLRLHQRQHPSVAVGA